MKAWDNSSLTAYLDKQILNDAEKDAIELELHSNSDARLTLAVLQEVKEKVFSTRTAAPELPANLRASIMEGIQVELQNNARTLAAREQIATSGKANQSGFISRIIALISKPIYALPAVALLAAAIFFLNRTQNTPSLSTDFCVESLQNFDAITAGKLQVQKATSDFAELRAFFLSNGISYDIINPNINAQLVGGVISERQGVKLAHFVYNHNGSLVYLYEAPEALFARHVLEIPSRLVPYAESGRWYSEHDSQNHSWMFWRVQTTYCTVVSEIPTDQLSQLFIGV